jgi:membrane-bound lytic murein transglycosylase A
MKLPVQKKWLVGSVGLGLLATSFSIAALLDSDHALLEAHGIQILDAEEGGSHSGPNLKKIESADLPNMEVEDADLGEWEAGSRDGLRRALTLQLARCKTQSQTATWDFAGKKVTRARWCVKTTEWFLSKLTTVSNLNELYQLARAELEWYQSVGRPTTNDVLFTGYYYPVLKAKKKADAVYKYPIYRKPSDLVQVSVGGKMVWRRKVGKKYVAYYTRAQIVNGALKGKGLELGYADNPIDPFMLEVQGSGAMLMQDSPTEEKVIINYAAQNGAGYVSLGKVMRDNGVPEEYINLQGIKRYFTENPDRWLEMSNQNPSQVFFKTDTDGPYGSAGVLLTPKHSIAVDTSEFPMGGIALIQTDRPAQIMGDQTTIWKPFAQFVVAQDTGGAIRSPGRVDVYWGSGDYAAVAAGQTANLGSLYFALVPEAAKLKPTPQFKGPNVSRGVIKKRRRN